MCHPTLVVAWDTKMISFHDCGLLWIAAEFDCHQAALDSCMIVTRLLWIAAEYDCHQAALDSCRV